MTGIGVVTVDEIERTKFNRLAQTWWDTAGPMWPLHKLNELRGPFVIAEACRRFGRSADAPSPLAGLRALDIGCGAGLLAEAMARAGADVTGIDVAERNVLVARDHAATCGLKIDYRIASLEQLDDEQFDVVLNMEVVEHVADLPAFMALAAERTSAEGLMFVATINRTLTSWLIAKVGAEYVMRWLPKGTHRWRHFVKPDEIEQFLARAGLRVITKRGVRINSFTRTFRLCGVPTRSTTW